MSSANPFMVAGPSRICLAFLLCLNACAISKPEPLVLFDLGPAPAAEAAPADAAPGVCWSAGPQSVCEATSPPSLELLTGLALLAGGALGLFFAGLASGLGATARS